MLSLITGVGSKGQVGEAVATSLARRGDTVLLVTRRADEARERATELASAGLRAHGYGCDLSVGNDVTALASRISHEHGASLDALVNLAGGFASSGAIGDSDPAIFDHQLRINLQTAYLATRAFLPMVRRARGSIVFFASEAALEGARTRGLAAYAAAKAAVVALMRSVADESRDHGVRANALAPAAIRTATNEAAMGADSSYVEREDVAAVVSFLCSPSAAAITGQVIRLRK
ncbi:MAG TPA: SDR family oxidoreductase [Gemmatimonadaceae bacterium]|nr:SDR family oxidoreductase [Gemmatimonadaceae bacterium]